MTMTQILRRTIRAFHTPALMAAIVSLAALAFVAFRNDAPLLGLLFGVITLFAVDALADYRAEQARATQALYFVGLLTNGGETTVTLVHQTMPEEPAKDQAAARLH